ncbi:C6 finger domain protein [Aspergillus granulosus]|uniref:C6 finger domain protein n=1 Tax=Aspergillus granulosus TaxID=176169 RepID=A0ABR4GYN3_9EURO
MSTPKRRFHGGCWTCKVKHRKCDRARPACRTCDERGVLCEGYEVRLRWGSGVASRGRFTGAEAPTESSISPKVKGRWRDRARGGQQRQLHTVAGFQGRSACFTEDNFDLEHHSLQSSRLGSNGVLDNELLFQEFLSSGINVLHSTTVHDVENLLISRLPILSQQSGALYTICITIQISLKPELTVHFFEYFDVALTKFRSELQRNETCLEDGTLVAGLLLCTIGVMHGIPWTMHLRGMHNIFQLGGVDTTRGADKTFRAHLFEVLGIMDLPTFAIGRQYPHLGFWRQYCRNRCYTEEPYTQDDVEVVSGLPRSLVDIFSCIGDDATEQDFWNWPGVMGSFVQCQLWEAYRLAGVLAIRDGNLHPSVQRRDAREQCQQTALPSTAVLVARLLSCVDAVNRASAGPDARDTLAINAIPYPTFIAGLQTDILTEYPSLKESVRIFLLRAAAEPFWNKQYRIMLDLLEEYWTCTPGTVTIHQLAQAREIEVGLF